jgi:hypothetical protein
VAKYSMACHRIFYDVTKYFVMWRNILAHQLIIYMWETNILKIFHDME